MQELFNQIKSRLIRITGSLLRNEEDAADAVQETFCRIWQIRDRIRNEQEATAIAVQTAKNICIDQLRRKKVVHFEPLNTDHEKGETESLLLQIEAADEYRLVKELIEKALSPLQQKILEMKEIDGIEIEEISQKLNMQPTAVRMNLSRARKEIRNIYNKMNPVGINRGYQFPFFRLHRQKEKEEQLFHASLGRSRIWIRQCHGQSL